MTRLRPAAARPPAAPAPLPHSTGSEAYRGQANHYDQRTDAFHLWRELLVARLPVGRGDTVLDIGCGTGLCLPMLQDKVGPTGTVIGIDESAQMLDLAAERITEHGWDNVRLIAAPVAHAPIDTVADGAVFCAVHDVMQCPAALSNVLDHLRPGAPVAPPMLIQPGRTRRTTSGGLRCWRSCWSCSPQWPTRQRWCCSARPPRPHPPDVAMTAGLVVVLLTLSPTGGDPFSAGLLTWLIGLAATVAHPDRMVAGRRTTRHRPADRRSAAPVPVPLPDPHRQGSERDA